DPVQLMTEEIKRELEEFRVRIDVWERQEEVEREVAAVLEQLDTYEADGTLWAPTSMYGDDKDRPLVRSSDGSYLYFAADVAYVRNKLERGFVKRLAEFPEVVAKATERRGPHALSTYAIQLADDFHRFYHRHRVLESGEAEGFRLGLCLATQTVIARALDLIGVEAPERM